MAFLVGKCLLQRHLDRIGMTQSELAIRLGVTKQQINKYTRGVRLMSYETAYNISMIVGCEMHELYEWRIRRQ